MIPPLGLALLNQHLITAIDVEFLELHRGVKYSKNQR